MPLEHSRRSALDVVPLCDVAGLHLAADLARERLETVAPPRQQHAMPAAARQDAGDLGADAARRAGYDRYPRPQEQTRTVRIAAAVRPFASTTSARSRCVPFFAPARFHVVP